MSDDLNSSKNVQMVSLKANGLRLPSQWTVGGGVGGGV